MENDTRSKRSGKKTIETLEKSKEILEKYMNINYSNLTQDDMEKINNYYSYRLEEIKKAMQNNDRKEILDLTESSIKKNSNLEVEIQSLDSKHKIVKAEAQKIKELNADLTKKLGDKDKLSKMIIEKVNIINADKQKIINEESEKRNVIVKETENFVRGLQSKYEDELPEKKKLIEENQILRGEIEGCIKNSGGLKDMLENQLKEKEKNTEDIENKIKNDLKSKMENMSYAAQKYIFENSELKIQILSYKKKNDELLGLLNAFTQEYDKLKNELEKKKQDIILLSADNYELTLKYKSNGNNKHALQGAIAEHEKINSQFLAMKKLNKKLLEQYETLSKQCQDKNTDQI